MSASWGSDTAEAFRYTIVPVEGEASFADCNDNRMPDGCDVLTGTSEDCDENGAPDECDIADGASPDADQNGVPDACEVVFLRGDVNGDGGVPGDTADVLRYAQHCFLGGPVPPCLAAADADGDGEVCAGVTVIVYLAGYLFLGTEPPPSPFPGCGPASEEDLVLGCEAPPGC